MQIWIYVCETSSARHWVCLTNNEFYYSLIPFFFRYSNFKFKRGLLNIFKGVGNHKISNFLIHLQVTKKRFRYSFALSYLHRTLEQHACT